MLETLITSKTRIKLLLKFFLNSNAEAYLRNLAAEFGESSNAIRLELNKFEEAGLLGSSNSGNKKMYHANTVHPLFKDIHNIVLKHIGLDHIIDQVVERIGSLDKAFLIGDFARGKDNNVIDLALIGLNIDRQYLSSLVEKAEGMISRKIRYLIFSESEFHQFSQDNPNENPLILWQKEA